VAEGCGKSGLAARMIAMGEGATAWEAAEGRTE
jgi:hypothetical protein